MPMTVTRGGIADSRAAELGGYLISLKDFSVSQAVDVAPDFQRESLIGEEVFRGEIQTIEAVDDDTIRLTCRIPAGKPSSGQWNLGEIGIWNSAGRLFAHGSHPIFPKSSEFGLKFFVYVTMARLGLNVNITVSDVMSLPSAARVSSLLRPIDSAQNAVVVFDANPNQEEINHGAPVGESSPALAVKHGPGGSYWGFAGHNRVYLGTPQQVQSTSSFILDPASNGFWLSEGEVVLVQALSGSGNGQTRKMQYSAAAKRFVSIDQPFDSLNTNVKLAVWRSHANSVPSRRSGMPEHLVMGIGQNTFRYTDIATTASMLVAKSYTFVGNGQSSYTLPAGFPLSTLESKNHLLVSVGGTVLTPAEYQTLGQELRLNVAAGTNVQVVVLGFFRDATRGGELVFRETEYTSTGAQEYDLPMIPDSSDFLMVFTNGGQNMMSPWAYTINGAKISFNANNQPPAGDVFRLAAFGNRYSQEIRGNLVRDRIVVTNAVTEVTTSQPIGSAQSSLVFRNGKILPHNRYNVAGNRVVFKDQQSNVVIDVLNFRSSEATVTRTKSGFDSGPQWIDPAGNEGTPNRLVPVRRRYVVNDTTAFEVNPVYDINHLMVFAGDRYLDPTQFLYDGTFIYPKEQLVDGSTIEIICFTEQNHPGTNASPQLTRVTGNGGNSYTIHTGGNVPSLVVTVGGSYIPSTAWNYDANSGALVLANNAPAGQEVVAWSYRDTPADGKQVRMFANVTPIVSSRTYGLTGKIDEVSDMLAFGSGTALSYSLFGMKNEANFSYLEFGATPASSLQGLDLQVPHFMTRTPQLRLVLRTELENYLQKGQNLADVPDKAAARANLGITAAIEASLDRVLLKVNNLADVPDKAAARDNLGITSLYNQLANNVLFKSNNLADVPDKATARDNLGITAVLNNLMQQVLFRNNNLADVPDKAAARANLGISDSAGVQATNNGNDWRIQLGTIIIIGGRYRHPTVVKGERTLAIPFHTQFPNSCFSVVQSVWLPGPNIYWDSIPQLMGNPRVNGFDIQLQVSEAKASTINWQGLDYIAIGN